MWQHLRRDVERMFARLSVPDVWGRSWGSVSTNVWAGYSPEQKARWSKTREENRAAKMGADPEYAARVKKQRRDAYDRWAARQKAKKKR